MRGVGVGGGWGGDGGGVAVAGDRLPGKKESNSVREGARRAV